MSNIAFLVFFELLNLFLHEAFSTWTNDHPYFMLVSLVIVASFLLPLHHKLQHNITEKLIANNKSIRLRIAKKTIVELDDQYR